MLKNRNKELLQLEEDFTKPYATINFIFGRRKIGKTTLINEYTKNKNVLQLSSLETTKDFLLDNLKKSVNDFFNNQNNIVITTTYELFEYISAQEIDEKLILVIENINDLISIDREFSNEMFLAWNKQLKNLNLQIILSSSTYSSILNAKHFKRPNNTIKLDSAKNENDSDYIHTILDSNISYLKYYNKDLDFYANIENMFLKYDSPLFYEGINIIKNELNDIGTYLAILYAISVGNNKIGDIAAFINLKSTYITRYMQKLVDIMILDKKFPINDNPEKSKFGRYEFSDNFMKFWFCFIYPNFNLINQNKPQEVLQKIKLEFEEKILEHSCKKSLIYKIENNYDEIIGFKPIKIGSWWNNREKEIDIVAYNSKYIIFIDCYKKGHGDLESLEKELINKSKSFKTSLLQKYMIYK